MKLRPCRACGKSISSAAAKCPHCGQPIHHVGRTILYIIISVIIVVFIGLQFAHSEREKLDQRRRENDAFVRDAERVLRQ